MNNKIGKYKTALVVFMLTVLVGLTSQLTARQPETLQGSPAPSISTEKWLNSKPLEMADLKGQVVMVEFWTYGCYNCKNVEPYMKQWYSKYHKQGFEIVAVHSPEFAHEREIDNVRAYVKRKQISWPVAIDNDFAIWKRYNNRYWPVMILIDKQGRMRYRQIGEGAYEKTENMIKTLLAEPNPA